jgi:hypothetical protein
MSEIQFTREVNHNFSDMWTQPRLEVEWIIATGGNGIIIVKYDAENSTKASWGRWVGH